MAEQLALDQLFGNRRAVHFDERPRRRAGWRRESRAPPVPCRCRSRRKSARGRWWPAISASCCRSAFIGHALADDAELARRPIPSGGSVPVPGAAAARAFFSTTVTFSMVSGFSRKSNAPSLVAFTAVSMVPWPEMMTTSGRSAKGISWMRASVSRPSMPGSQTSSSTSVVAVARQFLQARFAALDRVQAIAFVFQHAGERFADAGSSSTIRMRAWSSRAQPRAFGRLDSASAGIST